MSKKQRPLNLLLTAPAFLFLLSCPVLAEDTRPRWDVPRSEENWSAYRPGPDAPFWERVKHLDLSRNGSVWLSAGGDARMRFENWNNFRFASGSDESFLLTRLYAHGDLHIGEPLRVFVQGLSANVTDRDLPGGRRVSDVDAADIHNAFVEMNLRSAGGALGFRAGRQSLRFGAQRLVGTGDWANVRKGYDGLRGWWRTDRLSADVFYTRPVELRRYDSNRSNDDQTFWGTYATLRSEEPGRGLDVYVLNRHVSSTREDRYTPGVRWWQPLGRARGEIESAVQLGDRRVAGRSEDIRAFMVAGEASVTSSDRLFEPTTFLRFDYASGDKSATDSRNTTFDPLFPAGHAHLGWADHVGRQNVTAFAVGTILRPTPPVNLHAVLHSFYRSSNRDGLYDAGGTQIRSGTATRAREIGQEIDLLIQWKVRRELRLTAGYSHLFAGEFIDRTTPGSNSDVRFFHTSVDVTF